MVYPKKNNSQFARINYLNKIYDMLHPNETLFEFLTNAKKDISIEFFRGMGLNKCIENASLFQNYMTFLGYETYLLKLYNFDIKEGHALNIVRFDNKNLLYDISYLTYNKNGLSPNFKLISDEELQKIKNGELFTIEINRLKIDENGNQTIENDKNEYCLLNKRFQYFQQEKNKVKNK